MTEQAQQDNRSAAEQHHDASPGMPTKYVHDGRTPAAWTGAVVAMAGFLIGGLGMVFQHGPHLFFWIGAIVVGLGLIATLVLQKLGLGAY